MVPFIDEFEDLILRDVWIQSTSISLIMLFTSDISSQLNSPIL
jgi:hypothetical protein